MYGIRACIAVIHTVYCWAAETFPLLQEREVEWGGREFNLLCLGGARVQSLILLFVTVGDYSIIVCD
jgi:hypothetical protein